MSAKRQIQTTRDYQQFLRSADNRPKDPKKHKKLLESMRRYGFLPCFPIVCYRNGDGQLVVKDGQHRLMFAETLGLPVHYVEEPVDFDVAVVNSAAKVWVLRDYADKYAANGLGAYTEGLDFADQHHLPVGTAFALLAGTVSFNNCQEQFISGEFKVKDRPWADAVAGVYGPLVGMSSVMKNARFIEACMAVCRVKEFDRKRLLGGAARCRDKLVAYSTRDAYLDMLETVYNFGRSQLFGLKAAALNAMRERSAAPGEKKKRAAASGKAGRPEKVAQA